MAVIPETLPLSYASRPRPLSSAKITVRPLAGGGLEQRIVHGELPGITREMLFWWMHHIGDPVDFEGFRVKAYRLWHPSDHVDWESDGPVRPGARFHIVEAFQRQPRFLVDNWFEVPKLDEHGFRIETRFYGLVRLSVDEDWEDVPGGVRWTNTMQLRGAGPIGKLLFPLLRNFMKPMLAAWLTHNVEEVGFIPDFLPRLFAARR